jgi:ADP-ribosyl-[dinitrogen reductase] hydrolase
MAHSPGKTSKSHPLRIAEARAGDVEGRIGITFCPGKKQQSDFSGLWDRDLDIDLDAVRDWGAAAAVTLVEEHELAALKVKRMGQAVADRHMDWLHLPIQDVSTPTAAFEAVWQEAGEASVPACGTVSASWSIARADSVGPA